MCAKGGGRRKIPNAVCPKVPYTSNVYLFSAIGGWIPKPFDLKVVHMCGFDLLYDEA